MKRYSDALSIANPGAVNPSGIVHAILDACREIRAEPTYQGTATLCNDPAIRLMITQLAYICNANSDIEDYGRLLSECHAKATERRDNSS